MKINKFYPFHGEEQHNTLVARYGADHFETTVHPFLAPLQKGCLIGKKEEREGADIHWGGIWTSANPKEIRRGHGVHRDSVVIDWERLRDWESQLDFVEMLLRRQPLVMYDGLTFRPENLFIATRHRTGRPLPSHQAVLQAINNKGWFVGIRHGRDYISADDPELKFVDDIQVAVTVNGEFVSPSKISQETWNNLRK